MRLIDADALKEEIEFHPTSVSVCATVEQARGETNFKLRCLEDIDNAPTIPAITIDWLREKMRGYASTLKSTEMDAVVRVLKMWEQDQRKEKSE